jgi:hypothetical protein
MMYKTKYYELDFSPAKNQIDWKVKGFWPSVDVVPELEGQWDAILRQVKPGFHVLADMTEMKAAPQAVEALHIRIQQKIMAAGASKVATIVSASAIAALAGKRVGKDTGFIEIAQNFTDQASAQAWLDE